MPQLDDIAERFPFIGSLLGEDPPRHTPDPPPSGDDAEPLTFLFHYTDSEALIGICRTHQLWAGRAADMNDETEQLLAVNIAERQISNRLEYQNPAPAEVSLLEHMRPLLRDANRQIYTVSLSELRDSLSQWRAYGPRSGAVAVGLPITHLRKVAHEQGFYLAPCVYDHGQQQDLVHEILEFHIASHLASGGTAAASNPATMTRTARNAAADLAKYGPLVKDQSFEEELEWRLVSSPSHIDDPKLLFRSSTNGLRVFRTFDIVTDSNPQVDQPGLGVVVGPNVDSSAQQVAVQMLLRSGFGPTTWHSRTSSPYR